jgi:O-antigen ligase
MRTIAFWLSLLLIFTIPAESLIESESFGTMSKLIGFLLAAFWMGTVVITNKIRKPSPFHIVFIVFALWHIVSVFWTIDFNKTQVRLLTYVQLIALAYILWDLYTTPEALKAGLQAYVLGAWMSIGSLGSNYIRGATSTYTRYTAAGFGEGNIGIILVLGIPIAWYLIMSKGHSKLARFLTVANYVYIPAAVFGILLTGSRASLITSGFAFLYILSSSKRLKLPARVLICVALVFALYGVYTIVPDGVLQRLGTARESVASGDLNGRVEIWRAGLDVFSEHPLLGIGTNAFPSAIELGKAAHNTYLSILVEVGIIGFVLFTVAMVITVYNVVGQPNQIRQFWLAILMVLAVGILTLNWGHRKQTWLFPTLIVVSAGLTAQQIEPAQLHNQRGQQGLAKRVPTSA